jgi:carboxyl-terminal processing protease
MRNVPLFVIALAAIVVGAVAGRERPGETYAPLAVYGEAMSIVHDQYVDPLPWAKITVDGTQGMVETLDPDSALLTAQQYQELTAGAPSDKGDVGLALGRLNGALAIVAARDGAPARAAGLRTGDYLLKIDGVGTESMLPIDAANRLRGRPGTAITLSVGRTGWADPKAITLTRAELPPDRVSDRALRDGVIYLRIPELRADTVAELGRTLDATPGGRATGLILDLRDTPGGDIPAAGAVAGKFLEAGCVVARVESREPGTAHELPAAAAGDRYRQPMAVLVNHGTESAAEVLAGALQDWGRAVIVGSPTYGDASRQSAIPLPSGQVLYLTTARYRTPKDRAISGKGITPDVAAGAPATADLTPAPTSAKAESEDPEVTLAFELVKAAKILEHGASPATASTQDRAAARCGPPAA